jgi:leucyl-tRNA synthetase
VPEFIKTGIMEYNFREVEKYWQEYWSKNKTFRSENGGDKPKYYVLDMFPYPSGAGLHVGHPLGYIASDIVARYKRLKGYNVLHPMGFDSFGLPAEQYAIQTGQHPKVTTELNITRYRQQMDKIGFSFDWDREVRTSDPSYYKWTQWIFTCIFHSWYNAKTDKAEHIENLVAAFEKEGNETIKAVTDCTLVFSAGDWNSFSEKEQQDILMQYRLAYLSEAWVNWCPQLGTVLANDEVKDGVSERGGYPVERKRMPQWSMRITAYAERLLNDLEALDWSESMKESQRNWIGKSVGTSLTFDLKDHDSLIEVFTTRPDTVFGVSFLTLAPEHELVAQITTAKQQTEVDAYITFAKNRSERERQADVKKITGVFTGAYALHPFTGNSIPVWIGDYVLAGYGTGAVMAVPAHDSRDYAFAKHFSLPIPEVVAGGDISKESYDAKEGKLIHSDFLNGMEVKQAIAHIILEIEKRGLGKGRTNYRLRDAAFGRQRYWGEPIPVYYKEGIPYTLPESELPLVLPEIDSFLPTASGEPPLGRAKDWKYKGEYSYETTTMPGWAGSSWYYLRYMDPGNTKEFASRKALDYWKNVDLYIGGSEHATGHLLYVRFWTKFLKDRGFIGIEEPAQKLINQGMIQGVSVFLPLIHWAASAESSAVYFCLIVSPERLEEIFKAGGTNLLLKMIADQNPNTHHLLDEKPVSNFVKPEAIKYENRISVEHVDSNTNAVDQVALRNWVTQKEDIPQIITIIPEADGKLYCKREVEKMSKSKWNVVTPDSICEQYGADCLRLYEMFLGPLEQSKPWNTNGITGVSGFIRKLWKLYHDASYTFQVSDAPASKPELKALHKTIKKVMDDIERYSFNTSVSNFMICVNELSDLKCNKREILEPLAVLVSPYAPHISEELWKLLGNTESITYAAFPEYIESHTLESAFNYPVSLNGKTKFFIELDVTLTPEDVEKEVLTQEQTLKLLEGKAPRKVIVVHKKIVNIVI